jgi:hypothetical protein
MAKTFTNLSAAVTAKDHSIPLASTSGMAVGDRLVVGREVMQVNAIPVAGTADVQRGMDGTLARAHASLEGAIFGGASDFTLGPGDKSIVEGGGVTYTAAGVLTHSPGQHNINGAAAIAMTLAVPDAADEGVRIDIIGQSAAAHTVTITGGHGGGGAGVDVATFSAVGDSLSLQVQNSLWCLLASDGVSIA